MTVLLDNILTVIVFLPLLAVPFILLIPERHAGAAKWIVLLFMSAVLALSLVLYFQYDPRSPIRAYGPESLDMQFVEHHSWISALNVEYLVGIDGISLPMLMLTTLVSFSGVIASWKMKFSRSYFALYCLLYTGMAGVFVSLDLFLFYVFWEVMLLPMYFLIGIWGGERKEYAAIKFFLYTLLGSVFMLVALIALYYGGDINPDPAISTRGFDLVALGRSDALSGLPGAGSGRALVWLALFLGFAVKVPVFPFHTWLPDAHVEAPTPVSVILAGVLLKMGTYGLLRVNYFLLPEETVFFGPYLIVGLGVVNIVYGSLAALAQTDMKRIIAFSSIGHMGFVLLGMGAFNETGLSGAVLQMFNHGTITTLLFILIGVLYDRAHHRRVDGFGGLAAVMPRYTTFTAFAFFAALGLPGLAGFISEALCLMGGFDRYPVAAVIAVSGIVFSAGYLLWMMQRVFLGPVDPAWQGLEEIKFREIASLIPCAIPVVLLGLYPLPILQIIGPTLSRLQPVLQPFL